MVKIDKMEKFLKEEKPKKEKDLEVGFDIESFEKDEDTDTLGFRSEFEPIGKGEEKSLKKEIQNDGNTPGLKKSIKKFEDFKISISVDEVEPEEDLFVDEISNNDEKCCSNCQCEPCECGETTGDVDCCRDCQCEPCECNSEESENVVRFEDFLKNIM